MAMCESLRYQIGGLGVIRYYDEGRTISTEDDLGLLEAVATPQNIFGLLVLVGYPAGGHLLLGHRLVRHCRVSGCKGLSER